MKTIAVIFCLMAGIAGMSEEYISPATGRPVPQNSKFTLDQIKARDERVMRKTGGFIFKKASGPQALFIDARAKPTLTIDELARVYGLATHLKADIAKEPRGEKAPLAFAQERMATAKPLFIVVVVEGCDLPTLSIYPEERIGLVNADKLTKGPVADPSIPELRVSKELWRAIGFVGGVGFAQMEKDIMQPIYTLEELDANNYPFIQPMNMAKMMPMWKHFGVTKERRIPYRVAVKEGWASAPTNDYQKAVWEEIKADKERGPAKPLTIPPPAKK